MPDEETASIPAALYGNMWEELHASAMFLQVFNKSMIDPKTDVTPLLQLGYAIMNDKPIVVVIHESDEIPLHLAKAADEVVRIPDGFHWLNTPEIADKVHQSIQDAIRQVT